MTTPKLNCKNRTVFIGDNREVMLGLNRNIADAIITDPPFNSNRRYDHVFDTDPKDKKGKHKPGFDDHWSIQDLKPREIEFLKYKDEDLLNFCEIVGRTHSFRMEAYLMMMASRLLLCHELLKETGSIFLHCDSSANNYLRTLMDMIFGKDNFRNEIAWCYTGPSAARKQFPRKHDTILWYSKSDKWTFNADAVRVPYLPGIEKKASGSSKVIWSKGHNKERVAELAESGKIPESWWTKFSPVGRIHNERCGWSTQKPVSLYSRFVLASTNPGDVVLDPFCGCATTLVAAENAGRQWIGIDRDEHAEEVVLGQLGKLANQTPDFWRKEVTIRRGLPKRTDNKISAREHNKLKKELMAIQTDLRSYLYCVICDHPKDHFDLDVDHKHPQIEGGGWELKNLQLLCGRCNRKKGWTKTNEQVRAELRREGLLYSQRLKVHAYMKRPTPSAKDFKEGKKQRKKPRWKEDLEKGGDSGQTSMGI